MQPTLKEITEKAERLYELRQLIAAKEAKVKEELDPLKAERDAMQTILVDDLKVVGLSSIKVASGETYTKATKKGIAVIDEIKALRWAIRENAVKIDSVAATRLLRNATVMPEGIAAVETNYISVRKPVQEAKYEEETNNQ